jgi:hypothetical protein
MLGSGMVAQVAAVPAELDASFRRALPLLRDGYIDDDQVRAVRKILAACSLTYISSSLVSVLYIWPWLGRRPTVHGLLPGPGPGVESSDAACYRQRSESPCASAPAHTAGSLRTRPGGRTTKLVRRFGKPVIRRWLRLAHGL